jgi:hypothetical protein
VLTFVLPRHWRYISCYHGPWLTFEPRNIENGAHANLSGPVPPPLHPGTWFDLVKIRKLVADAVTLTVKAGGEAKHSVQYYLKRNACRLLAQAYRIDEIAASVVIMQQTSSLGAVGAFILREKRMMMDMKDWVDAQYLNFFEEKIPSRQVAEFTSLDKLDEVINWQIAYKGPGQELAATYRTRALVLAFKDKHEEAATMLKLALDRIRKEKPAHADEAPENGDGSRGARNPVRLKAEEQPGSLESQLHFQRGGMLLMVACKNLDLALSDDALQGNQKSSGNGKDTDIAPEAQGDSDGCVDVQQSVADGPANEILPRDKARQKVKENARLALREYMAFLAQLEYTPNATVLAAQLISKNLWETYGDKTVISKADPPADHETKLYKMSDLFHQVPVKDLPEWPPKDPNRFLDNTPSTEWYNERRANGQRVTEGEPDGQPIELVTSHPLLVEALHSLLLCHCLMQTPPAELSRHAYMVSRLYHKILAWPFFQGSRSPARSNWIEVLKHTGDKLQLAYPWEKLAPYPMEAVDERPLATQRSIKPPVARRRPGTYMDPEDKDMRNYHWRAADIARWVNEVPRIASASNKRRRRKPAPAAWPTDLPLPLTPPPA